MQKFVLYALGQSGIETKPKERAAFQRIDRENYRTQWESAYESWSKSSRLKKMKTGKKKETSLWTANDNLTRGKQRKKKLLGSKRKGGRLSYRFIWKK